MSAIRWWRSSRPIAPWATKTLRDVDIRTVRWTIVSVRALVVVSVAVLLTVGTHDVRQHMGWAWTLLAIAVVYSLAGFYEPATELGGAKASAVVTTLDGGFSLAFIAVTGGATSPLVGLLFLTIVAAATRLSPLNTVLASLALSLAYFILALTVSSSVVPPEVRWQAGLWWPVYFLLTAALTTVFTLLTQRAAQAHAEALAEVVAEHSAAEEERDLRARLLKSYEAQETGLQVILHELRTPISSLKALADNQVAHNDVPSANDQRMKELIAAHASHLSAMMDALGDVAASRRPTFSTGHRQVVVLHDFLVATADTVGLAPPQLRLTVSPPDTACRFDTQLLRRVITNLLENAFRHGRGKPVDLIARVSSSELHIEILDRGPGLPRELTADVTEKYVSVGDQRGRAGLGLWIADQIVLSLNGRLKFGARTGGGLAVYLDVQVDRVASATATTEQL
ncbi:sensor histidine kinase [Nocardia wallacei]|uniref:sensor histidine kinase n=1 Tax=Nocardia wallacei TaxID=480035 RepID=UPI0024542FD9|nr:HAMP domain-containing sensor histidine kinase [Nocardia wallacei]